MDVHHQALEDHAALVHNLMITPVITLVNMLVTTHRLKEALEGQVQGVRPARTMTAHLVLHLPTT